MVPRSTSNLGLCNNYLQRGGGGGVGRGGGGNKRGHRGKSQLEKLYF